MPASFAELSINVVENACVAAIADIHKERARRAAVNATCRWWQARRYSEFAIKLYCGRQEVTCEDLIALCRLARASGSSTIKVSAEDADCFASFAAFPSQQQQSTED